ncbi:MAG TPA: hypothetical protein ENH65_04480 [Candidatus Aminicenantes bacterium]|nr:hypothetical protein [Candidatus Aminicenantes bacterium]
MKELKELHGEHTERAYPTQKINFSILGEENKMKTYQPTHLRPPETKKIGRDEIMYAIGEEHSPGEFGMWAGPIPIEKAMLEMEGESDKSRIIRFNKDGTDAVIWKWNDEDLVWEEFDESKSL